MEARKLSPHLQKIQQTVLEVKHIYIKDKIGCIFLIRFLPNYLKNQQKTTDKNLSRQITFKLAGI